MQGDGKSSGMLLPFIHDQSALVERFMTKEVSEEVAKESGAHKGSAAVKEFQDLWEKAKDKQ